MRSMIHTPTLLQSQGTRHIYTQPPPRASRILSLPCVPGMTQATELHVGQWLGLGSHSRGLWTLPSAATTSP